MNQQLRNELLSMQKEDQRTLQKLIDNGELGTNEYHPKMKVVHKKTMYVSKKLSVNMGGRVLAQLVKKALRLHG